MASRSVTFPFTPKSTTHLEPGCFWPIRLSNGRYSAGLVLVVEPDAIDTRSVRSTRVFTAGLLTWSGAEPPTAEGLLGADLVDWGRMHVRAIGDHGEQVLGRWDGVDSLTRVQLVSHRRGGTVQLFSNGHVVGRATPEEARTLPVSSTWGLDFLWQIAERVHVRGLPVVP